MKSGGPGLCQDEIVDNDLKFVIPVFETSSHL